MKIIHTSDWHLGASLGEVSRAEDHRLFLDWLRSILVERNVDTLLIAGDIFDQSNPSAEAQRTYYTFLNDLEATPLRQVIITGGNHDSPSRLDAPRELLGGLGVHVVGGLDADPGTWGRCLCPLRDANGEVAAVVAAAPFVNEYRLGFRALEGAPESRGAQLAERFRAFYTELADLAQGAHPGVPLLAMGHLACQGSAREDAPQEIHLIGSLGALPETIFDPRFQYVALGHIHRNYALAGGQAHYCGSPVPLNAREGATARRVNLLTLEGGEITLERLEVPAFRSVVELSGAPEGIAAALAGLAPAGALPTLLSLNVLVERHQPGLEETLRAQVAALDPSPILWDLRQTQLAPLGAGEGFEALPALDALDPREVFRLLCAARHEQVDELMPAFDLILSETAE